MFHRRELQLCILRLIPPSNAVAAVGASAAVRVDAQSRHYLSKVSAPNTCCDAIRHPFSRTCVATITFGGCRPMDKVAHQFIRLRAAQPPYRWRMRKTFLFFALYGEFQPRKIQGAGFVAQGFEASRQVGREPHAPYFKRRAYHPPTSMYPYYV
ncbi:uncharacterized protein F5Z01DRAFT_360413 [Emericellopsis atlantica]|uniref:Uncharacterized protein n=1 Tax=Emericellopsis atlantica TaxID=2614577 RepID=A0A9P8CL33_9HYPO|nr:uncharacterized protein F5Z01DRAFT_360413 [Emericellopsis atlantica]KAG9250575.1 hypothetical protein F5Z01DRAFT_360413 [Emericellopsis atlantica]